MVDLLIDKFLITPGCFAQRLDKGLGGSVTRRHGNSLCQPPTLTPTPKLPEATNDRQYWLQLCNFVPNCNTVSAESMVLWR